MTVKQFQKIGTIEAIDNIDHIGYIICELFNLTVEQVELLPKKKQIRLANKVASELLKVRTKTIFHPKFTTDATKITLGQFMEINEWLKRGVDECLHMVAASILRKRKDHKKQSEILLNTDIRKVLPYVEEFLNSFADLMQEYEGLFESNASEEGEEAHPFIEQFGWWFTAKSIAEYLSVGINDAYKINIIEALNIMSYLKSLNDYQQWQQKETI